MNDVRIVNKSRIKKLNFILFKNRPDIFLRSARREKLCNDISIFQNLPSRNATDLTFALASTIAEALFHWATFKCHRVLFQCHRSTATVRTLELITEQSLTWGERRPRQHRRGVVEAVERARSPWSGGLASVLGAGGRRRAVPVDDGGGERAALARPPLRLDGCNAGG